MMKNELDNWHEANQQWLMAAIRVVQAELEKYHAVQHKQSTDENDDKRIADAQVLLDKAAEGLQQLPALETVVKVLGLSSFERKILLLCAAVELDADFAALIAGMQGSAAQLLPTFSLAMAVFEDAHWSALSPNGPLRYWRLVEPGDHQLITKSPLRIDEQLLHYIAGINAMDERFNEIVEPVSPGRFLVTSHLEMCNMITRSCSVQMQHSLPLPVIQFSGDEQDKPAIAAYVSSDLGKKLYAVSSYSVPVIKKELTELIRLWNREAAINGYALLLDCVDIDTADKSRLQYVQHFIENIKGLLFVSTDRWSPKIKRHNIILDVLKPTRAEQTSLWEAVLGNQGAQLNGQMDKLVGQFNMSAKTIQQVSDEIFTAKSLAAQANTSGINEFKKNLWKLCCKHSRPHVDDLAQRIEPAATWNDIVLPAEQKDILREIAMQVRQRKKVYDEWGFAGSGSRGLGISAMFTGESGTGKTMAAEVLANELQLDLYRIDLSQVVNKYIGETEKNLKRIFDAAEEGGAILLFDEADALFGKRSEVKDSHDRYGNIEVSYLLQRMEAYRGLAILTTNMKSALDKAFLRRIRFIVQFPFPGISQRAEIWAKVFPHNTPIVNLDVEKLAKLSLPGGHIRNIAMNAAFIAADENMPVGMSQVLRAARSEYNKLEKPMNSIETEKG